jgi:uncharacterized phage protein (TIGR02218 family)
MSFLSEELSTAAFCWRVARRDGVVMGFTTHDRDLEVDGLTYRAAPGMRPSAVTLSAGFEAGALEVEGALTSAAIRGEDLLAGRWDGAAVELFQVDWAAPGERVPVMRGTIGEVSMTGPAFEAELKGAAAVLDMPVAEQTSPTCRAQLGDRRCRVDLAARTRMARVTGVPAEDRIAVAGLPPGNSFGHGRVRWIGGANSGIASDIGWSDGALIALREAPPFAVAAGDLLEIAEGCDKRLDTCTGRFGNAANFRGEPHLPGIDILTRYPGS